MADLELGSLSGSMQNDHAQSRTQTLARVEGKGPAGRCFDRAGICFSLFTRWALYFQSIEFLLGLRISGIRVGSNLDKVRLRVFV